MVNFWLPAWRFEHFYVIGGGGKSAVGIVLGNGCKVPQLNYPSEAMGDFTYVIKELKFWGIYLGGPRFGKMTALA